MRNKLAFLQSCQKLPEGVELSPVNQTEPQTCRRARSNESSPVRELRAEGIFSIHTLHADLCVAISVRPDIASRCLVSR